MAIQKCPVKWSYRHVKGHQDDDGTRKLDRWARLNVEMDNLAKAFWEDQVEMAVVRNIVFPEEYWTFRIQGVKVSSRLDEKIRESIHGTAMMERWVRKRRFTGESYRHVNWEACEKAMKSLNLVRRHWIAKHVSGHAGCWEQDGGMEDAGDQGVSKVWEVEDTRHVWTCKAPEARLLDLNTFISCDSGWLRRRQIQRYEKAMMTQTDVHGHMGHQDFLFGE